VFVFLCLAYFTEYNVQFLIGNTVTKLYTSLEI
jgi:hypothetical protein